MRLLPLVLTFLLHINVGIYGGGEGFSKKPVRMNICLNNGGLNEREKHGILAE